MLAGLLPKRSCWRVRAATTRTRMVVESSSIRSPILAKFDENNPKNHLHFAAK
jgi:hypothetical protein